MSRFSEGREITKTLQRFRFVTASAILSNTDHIDALANDIHQADHIARLCDQYALRLLIEWLATKYGFPIYAPSIENGCKMVASILQTWPMLADAYPFNCELEQIISEDVAIALSNQAIQVLESALPARIGLISSLYELFSFAPLNIDAKGEIHIQRSSKRRLLGQFYTPPWVVAYCYDIAFKKDLEKLMSGIKACSKMAIDGRSFLTAQFKIFDPACGTGNFLVGAVEWSDKTGLSEFEKFALIKHCLFGIELDGRAASLCRISLLLSLSQFLREYLESHGYDQAHKLVDDLLLDLRSHIVVADSLIAASSPSQSTPESKKEPLACNSFDLVITNPPYISYGSRNQPQLSDTWQKHLRKIYVNSAEYKIRLHSIFQDIALRYAAIGGRAVLFLPDAFLTGRYYQKLRLKLLQESQIESLSELPASTMPDAVVGRWCVASYIKRHQPGKNNQSVATAINADDFVDILSVNPERHFRLPLSIMVSKDRARFRLIFNEQDRDIWQAVDGLDAVGTVLTGHTGIRSHIGQAKIVARQKLGPSWKKGIISGGQVRRHLVLWEDTWLNISSALLFAGGHDPAIVEQPKILLRQTGDRLVAALDHSGLYHLNNVHAFSGTSNANLHYFAGLMNSSFWLYLYQLKSREAERALAQIDIEMVESMPLPEAKEEHIEAIAALVRRIQNCEKNKILTSLERAVDRLVYDLYELTDSQVAHIELGCQSKLSYAGALPSTVHALTTLESFEKTGGGN